MTTLPKRTNADLPGVGINQESLTRSVSPQANWTVMPQPELSMSDSQKKWGPFPGELGGESEAFGAPKGQAFPACERREGHFGSVGVKRQGRFPEKPEGSTTCLRSYELVRFQKGTRNIEHV